MGETTVHALKNIDLTIESGEFVAVWGPSGSGKTTLLNLIGTIDEPTRGDLLIKDNEVALLSDDQRTELRNRFIGFIFQNFNLILSYREKDRAKLGFFAGWTASDAFLLYGEGSISRGTNVLYPTEANNPFGASMEAADDKTSSPEGVFLVGGSYTLEMGPTLTMEYLYWNGIYFLIRIKLNVLTGACHINENHPLSLQYFCHRIGR